MQVLDTWMSRLRASSSSGVQAPFFASSEDARLGMRPDDGCPVPGARVCRALPPPPREAAGAAPSLGPPAQQRLPAGLAPLPQLAYPLSPPPPPPL